MYPDEDLDPKDLGNGESDYVYQNGLARFQYDDSRGLPWSDSTTVSDDETLSTYWLHESFMQIDYDGDGIAELRKVCSVGQKVLANEEIDRIPFVSITPIKIPHKFFGLSIADLVMDIQKIKSVLMRNLMDNMYNQNFGRYAVLEGQANLDDLLTQRPGGVVRVKSPNAIMPLATPQLEQASFSMLDYLDKLRESRSGVNKFSQGLNAVSYTHLTLPTILLV